MGKFSKIWWGELFIEALESFTDSGRLSRGRSYAKNGKIKQYKINQGKITAKVRGTEIALTLISQENWEKAIAFISSQASFVSKLLMNEMPENIEEIFYQEYLYSNR